MRSAKPAPGPLSCCPGAFPTDSSSRGHSGATAEHHGAGRLRGLLCPGRPPGSDRRRAARRSIRPGGPRAPHCGLWDRDPWTAPTALRQPRGERSRNAARTRSARLPPTTPARVRVGGEGRDATQATGHGPATSGGRARTSPSNPSRVRRHGGGSVGLVWASRSSTSRKTRHFGSPMRSLHACSMSRPVCQIAASKSRPRAVRCTMRARPFSG